MKVKGQSKYKSTKIMATILAIFLLLTVVFVFVGCDSNTPRIIISISFDDGDANTNDNYELTYRLNRQYYPQTTRHYLALVESGFYNDTLIHDYQKDNNKMIGGAFSTENDVNQNDFKTQPNNVTPISVWSDRNRQKAIPNVLYGETESNGFQIINGGFRNEKGALGTYTYVYGDDRFVEDGSFTQRVYATASHNRKEVREIQYLGNTVTTMFYFSTTDTALDKEYCVFAVLDNNQSKSRFNDLINAIQKVENTYTHEIKNANIKYT